MTRKEILTIQTKLLNWYHQNKRELPWRNTTNPYKIWISEIILQQTRVKQGYQYYLNFIKRFPNVKSLAEAEEQEVLKQWQGLGYYTRARNLHKASKMIMCDFNGSFPTQYKDIISLAGIGEYTASAIASFAFQLPYAVLDGNVYRFLSRLFVDETPIQTSEAKKRFNQYATLLLNKKNPDIHNQAIMEMGALQCTPTSPNCVECPVNEHCKAFEMGKIEMFPVKKNKIKQRKRFFNYLFIVENGSTFIQKREEKDIWKNLYEFPLVESEKVLDWEELIKNETFNSYFQEECNLKSVSSIIDIKHVLTHQKIMARFFVLNVVKLKPQNTLEVTFEELKQYPITRLIEIFLEKQKLY